MMDSERDKQKHFQLGIRLLDRVAVEACMLQGKELRKHKKELKLLVYLALWCNKDDKLTVKQCKDDCKTMQR